MGFFNLIMTQILSLFRKPTATSSNETVVVKERKPEPQDDLPSAFRVETYNGLDLYEISVDELQHLLSIGALTSVEYTQFCLDRIQKVSHSLFFSLLQVYYFGVRGIGERECALELNGVPVG